jgi:uncharacterized protein involved in response to NO
MYLLSGARAMSFLIIEEPASASERPYPLWSGKHAFWALGFRPFYALAALLAVLAVPAWLASYLGWLAALPHITLGWHMHEMVFGFAIAVVVGFLFTAGRAWTGLWTPRGLHLAGLALVWVAGRAAMLTAPAGVAAAVDMLFLPLAAWSMFRVLQRAGNKRNMFLVGLLALLTAANGLFHAAAMGWIGMSVIAPIHAGILLIVQIESVIGGRVIPMFTDNAVPGTKSVVRPRSDQFALALLAAASAAWVFGAPGPVTATLAFAAAVATARRLVGWKPLRSLPVPLLWILHLSYAWIPLGFLLLALAALGLGAASTAFHALAVGSMAGLIVGMMTRTTLGHTGRKLVAGKAEAAMYFLIQAGAAIRVAAGIVPPQWRNGALAVSGACWTFSFILFLLVYTPYLWRRRLDGKEG